MKTATAKNQLCDCVEKSHGSHTEAGVRSIAWCCIDGGLRACGTGFLLLPVPYDILARYMREHDPDLELINDFTEYAEDDEDEYEEDCEEEGSSDAWTLTEVLEKKQCQKYFDVLWGPEGTQPYVTADLPALMSKQHLPYAQQLLQTVHTVRAHPKDKAYKATYNLHKAMLECKPEPPAVEPQASFLWIENAMQAATLHGIAKGTGRVAEDCEGCALSRTGQLCLVQMKAGNECYIFDTLNSSKMNSEVMQQLQAILEDDTVIKVMHDCRHDSAALWYQKRIKICNIFDTQVADGLVGLFKGLVHGQHCTPAIGLHSLLAKYHLPQSVCKTGIQEKMKNNPQLWKARPISQDLINYAIDEVSHLFNLQDKLTAELGTCQLEMLASLSLNYSQWCWLPGDRAVSKDAVKYYEVATLTPFKPGSWLGKLVIISQRKHAA